MSDQQGLQFECFKCQTVNTYPAVKDAKAKAGTTVVKKCTMCAADNKIVLPEGYTSQVETIFRGLE